MDTIKFIIEDYVDEEEGFRLPTINIYINGKNLIDLVDQVENSYRASPEDGMRSQSYIGLHAGYRRDFAEEFLGHKNRPRSVLLTCTCLEELCNSIVAKITVSADTVTWSEIRSPFLGAETGLWVDMDGSENTDGCPINYSALGPFVFDREQYLNALDELKIDK